MNTQGDKEDSANKKISSCFYRKMIIAKKKRFYMKKILFALLLAVMPFFVSAQEQKNSFDYYYSENCSHCQRVGKYFEENGIYEKFSVNKFSIDKSENIIKLKNILTESKYAGSFGVPVMLVGGKVVVGDEDIIKYFEPEKEPIRENKNYEERLFSLWTLVAAALVDAINPCAFAVLVLLLATVISAKGKNQAFWSGILFSLSIFVSYFLIFSCFSKFCQ